MSELRSKIPKRIGVVLSSESLWETVFSFYQIEYNNYLRMAIDLPVKSTIAADDIEHHRHIFENSVHRNLAGLEIVDASELKPGSLQALVVSVGESKFYNMCDFEQKGEAFNVNSDLRAFFRAIYRRGLPIGAFGHAVLLVVKSIQGITDVGPVVTVGNDPKLQSGIEAAGGQAINTRPTEVIIDHSNKLVTSGGQLATSRLLDVAGDCENMFKAILELIKG